MGVRLHNLTKWQRLAVGEHLMLRGSGPRPVRIELNTSGPAAVHVVQDDGRPVFVATVVGLEVLEFSVEANEAFVLVSDPLFDENAPDPVPELQVWYFTNLLEAVPDAELSPVSFTKLANRKVRNRDLEMMVFRSERNQMKRLQIMQAQMVRMEAAMAGAAAAVDPKTGEVTGDETGRGAGTGAEGASGDQAAPVGAPEASGEGAAGAAGGAAGVSA